MRKKILIFIFAIFALSSSAENINALLLHMTSGKPVCVMLEKSPTFVFEDDELVISSDDNEMRYISSNIKKITYTYIDLSDINDVNLPQSIFYFYGNTLRIKGIVPNSLVYIYNSEGRLVSKTTTDDKGDSIVPLPAHPKEIFIIKTVVTNFKITMQ